MIYHTKFTRLVNSGKLTNRFISAQIKESPDPVKSNMGTLYCVVEITKAWFPSAQIGQTIINTLAREYYRGASTSDLINFENALRKVNETLAQITQNGETEWIGNLNSVLVLICDNQLHLSSAGVGKAYLLRNDKIIEIIEGKTSSDTPHPLKTYGEITSGALEENDKILITSPLLLDYFPLNILKKTLQGSPCAAVNKIAKVLQHEKAKNINLIVAEIFSQEKIVMENTNDSKVVYLDKQGLDIIYHLPKNIMPGVKTFGLKLKDGFIIRSKQIRKITEQYLMPQAQKGLSKTKELTAETYSNLKNHTQKNLKKLFPIKKEIVPDANQKNLPEKGELLGKTIYTVHHYNINKKHSAFAPKIFEFLKHFWQKIKEIFSIIWHWTINPKNRSYVYIIIIGILLLVLITNIGILRNKQNTYKKQILSQETITELKKKLDDGKLALAYNNKEKAKNSFADIINQGNSISQKNSENEDLKNILLEAQNQLDVLTNTKRIKDLNKLTDFPNASQLFATKNDFLTVNPSDNKIYYVSHTGGNVNQHTSLPNAAGAFRTGTILDTTQLPIFFTDKNTAYLLKDPIIAPDEIKPKEGNWENAKAVASYSGNLYLLDTDSGQIYKHIKDPDGYGKGENYLTSQDADLKNSVSLAIDGAIYVLNKNGAIIKLIKGKPQTFSVRDIPTPNDKLTIPVKIWTSADENIYILDEQRIVELDKTGKFISQITFPSDIKDIQDFSLNTKENKVWILTKNKLYEGSL